MKLVDVFMMETWVVEVPFASACVKSVHIWKQGERWLVQFGRGEVNERGKNRPHRKGGGGGGGGGGTRGGGACLQCH